MKKGLAQKVSKIPEYSPIFYFEIFEIGNVEWPIRVDLDVDTDLIIKERLEWTELRPCTNKLTHKIDLKWKLKIKRINEETIIDLTSKPLLVKFSKILYKCADPEVDGIISPMELSEDLFGTCTVDLYDLISNKDEEITKLEIVKDVKQRIGKNEKTWSNQMFIRYTLKCPETLLSPSLVDEEFIEFSMSFDYIINTLEVWHEEEYIVDAIVQLPINGACKLIKLPAGVPSVLKDRPKFLKIIGFENVEGPSSFSKVEVQVNEDELKRVYNESYSNETGEEIDESIDELDLLECPIYAFYRVFRCKLRLNTLKELLANKFLSIEIMAKRPIERKGAPIELYCGLIDLGDLLNVDVKSFDTFVNLMTFNNVVLKALQCKESAFTNKKDRKAPVNLKKKDPGISSVTYITNSTGFKTMMKISVEIERPLTARIYTEPETIEMGQSCVPKNYYFSNRQLKKHLDCHLKDALVTFLDEFYRASQLKENSRKCSPSNQSNNNLMENESLYVNSERQILEAGCNWLSWHFNFRNLKPDQSEKDILDDAYIAIISKIHELRYAKELDIEKGELNILRLQFANECFELNAFEDARSFYLLNIGENPTSASPYIDYAIYNLLTLDMCMAYECCVEAIKLDYEKNSVVARLIQAYVLFSNRSYLKAELILLELTKFCDNFLEGWMALFLINFHNNREFGMNAAEDGFIRSTKSSFNTMQHKKQELVWVVRKSVNPYLNAIVTFIQWGCIGFAELGLAYHVHNIKCNSFDYGYNMALIDYFKRDYAGALRRLRCSSADNHYERIDKLKLQIHCFLSTNSPKALGLLKELSLLTVNKCFDRRTNLIYIKIANAYITSNKYRTARFYLKKCCFKIKSYAGLQMLGFVAYKCQSFGLAEYCYKAIFELNPFNKDTYPYLSIIYFAMDRMEHYQECADKADQIENLSEDLVFKLEHIKDTLKNKTKYVQTLPEDL